MFSPAEAGRLYDADVTRRDLFDPDAYDCRHESPAPAQPLPLAARLRLWFTRGRGQPSTSQPAKPQ